MVLVNKLQVIKIEVSWTLTNQIKMIKITVKYNLNYYPDNRL
jgi:hypothetical protein